MTASSIFRRKRVPTAPVSLEGAAYGLKITIEAPDPAELERLRSVLPPGWVKDATADTELRFTLETDDRRNYRVTLNGGPLLDDVPLDHVYELLPGIVRRYVAGNAPEVVFVHAGAVAHNGQGIVIPGRSFSGKTTLVAALARAGAEYYSDEYAVITPDGHLMPYAQDLSMRLTEGESAQTATKVSQLGGTAGSQPVKVKLLVLTEYRSRAVWQPTELSVAQGVVETLGHAEPVQDRPSETVKAIRQALDGATVLQGRRGDADETAAALLALLV